MPAAFLVVWAAPLVLNFYGYWKLGAYPKPLNWFMEAIRHMFKAAQYMMAIIPLAVLADALNAGFPADPWVAFVAAALACRLLAPVINVYNEVIDTWRSSDEALKAAFDAGVRKGMKNILEKDEEPEGGGVAA